MARPQKLNADDKFRIYTLYQTGMSKVEIAYNFKISERTLDRAILEIKKTLHGKNPT